MRLTCIAIIGLSFLVSSSISALEPGPLFGFCATTIGLDDVCTEVVEFGVDDHLMPRCRPWAESVGGSGWTFVNGRSKDGISDKHEARCDRVIEFERGEPHRCNVQTLCGGSAQNRDLSTQVRAENPEQAVERCIRSGRTEYLEALREAGKQGCWISPGSSPL